VTTRSGSVNVRFLLGFAVFGAAAAVLAGIATRDAGNIVASHHETGTSLSVRPLRDGRADGAWVLWYEDRFDAAQSHYARGAATGTWKRFARPARGADDTTFQTVLLEADFANGHLDGPFVRRAPDGTVIERGTFVGGVRHGEWRSLGAENDTLVEWWWRGHLLGDGEEAERTFRAIELAPETALQVLEARE
jgi:hypothetical protein